MNPRPIDPEDQRRLILAAPDLLWACEKALPLLVEEWIGTRPDSVGMVAIAALEDAIAKAKGKTP